jgi:hypothetical protein
MFGKVDDIYDSIYYAIEVMLNMMFNIIISRKKYLILSAQTYQLLNFYSLTEIRFCLLCKPSVNYFHFIWFMSDSDFRWSPSINSIKKTFPIHETQT